jgi:hypothetical protein
MNNYILFAQDFQTKNDTINKLDSLGKKNGVWIEYLTKGFRIANLTKNASYYRYVRYVHGIRFDYEIVPQMYIRKIFLNYGDSLLNNNNKELVLLDGTYKLYEKKRRVLFGECVFKKGFLQVQTIYEKEGKYVWFYEEKYQQNEFSFAMKYFSEYGEIKEDVFILLKNQKWERIERE